MNFLKFSLALGLAVAFPAVVFGVEVKKPPPVITEIEAATPEKKLLKEPKDYVVIASNNEVSTTKNSLTCKASNTDNITWEFVDKLNSNGESAWSTKLPTIMKASQPGDDGSGDVMDRNLVVDDGETTAPKELIKISGYYRCVARNTKDGYTTTSPTVRVISPYLSGEDPVGLEISTGNPILNKPFMLKCLQDQKFGANGKDVVSGYKINPENVLKYYYKNVKFEWKRNGALVAYDSAENKGRIKLDAMTGNLYFAYAISEDAIGENDEMTCGMKLGKFTSKLTNRILSMNVLTGPSEADSYVIVFPEKDNVQVIGGFNTTINSITCIAGEECQVRCIFGGKLSVNGKVRGVLPDGTVSSSRSPNSTVFTFKTPEGEGTKDWKCQLVDEVDPNKIHATVIIKVKVVHYPELVDDDNFKPMRYQEAGKDVEFVCDAKYGGRKPSETNFYINGKLVKKGDPSYVTYDREKNPLTMSIKNANRNNTVSVQCQASNEIGTLYKTSTVIVYDPPVVSQHPLPENPYIAEKSNETDTFLFSCNFTLDRNADSAEIFWYSNRKGLENDKITSADVNGVKNVYRPTYIAYSGQLESKLFLIFDLSTQDKIRNTKWWCEIKYTILGYNGIPPSNSTPVEFQIQTPKPEPVVAASFQYLPVILGAVGGFLFLILLVVLIHCFVQKNKGEQYYVGKKEEAAGHNPKEEMEAYGFSEYTRPDQNPVKGSRASMNFSDKPMESDTGSLDEYGDIDPGRYNEDGSFIGQYGQNGQPSRNQADV